MEKLLLIEMRKLPINKIFMKKFLLIFLILLIVLICGIIGYFVINRSNNGREEADTSTLDKVTAIPIDDDTVDDTVPANKNEDIIPARLDKSIGIKFWKQDPDFTVILNFKLEERYDLTNMIWGGQPSAKVSLKNGELLATISHMAIPIHYTSYSELTNTETGRTFYRVVFEDGTIAYVDEMITTGECPNAPVATFAPCGTPIYEGLNIECSSSLTIEECDEVMITLIVKDVK